MPATVSEIVPFLFLLMLIGSASIMIGLCLYTRRLRDNPVVMPYQLLMLCAAYWSLDYALDLSTATLSLKIFWQEIRFLVNPFFSVLEFWLILALLDKTRWIRGWRWKALLIIPIITAVLAITSRHHTLFRYNYGVDLTGLLPTLTMTNGPWYMIFIVYSYLLIMTGLLLLVLVQEESHRIYLKQRILLFIALMAPSALDILFQLGITPIPNVNPAPVFLWIIGLIYIIALFKFGFLELVPIARSRVIEEMGLPMIVLSTDGKIADINPAAGELLGDIAHGGVGELLNTIATDWPQLITFCSSNQTRGEIVKQDQEGERRFDARMDLLYSGSGTPEGRLILLTDTTIQKKLEQEIRTSEERWKNIVDGAPFPIVITQVPDNIIMLVNQRTMQQFHLTADELIGQKTDQFYVDMNTRERVLEILQAKENLDDIEMQMQTRDGRKFWVYASIRKIRYLDQDAFFISFADFTLRKQLEETLTTKNQELELITASLAETNKKLNLLSSITRHDILNRIQVISAISEIFIQDISNPDLQKRALMINEAGRSIQTLIEFTREYEDLGQKSPTWQEISKILHSPVIMHILSDLTLITPEQRVEIYADPMLSKVFFNLVENSIRHGGTISSITVSLKQEGTDLLIIYEDDGRGVPVEEKLLIFTRGYGNNTGLGLFFIREILEITGLTIIEDGIPGSGARFVITVPQGRYRFP